eukprot:203599-Prorocentrum_minimum.AAC.1
MIDQSNAVQQDRPHLRGDHRVHPADELGFVLQLSHVGIQAEAMHLGLVQVRPAGALLRPWLEHRPLHRPRLVPAVIRDGVHQQLEGGEGGDLSVKSRRRV